MNDLNFCNSLKSYINAGGRVLATGWIAYQTGYANSNYKDLLTQVSPFSSFTGYSYPSNGYNLVLRAPSHPILSGISSVSVTSLYAEYPNSPTLASSATNIATYNSGTTNLQYSIATNDYGSGKFTWCGMHYLAEDFYNDNGRQLWANTNAALLWDNLVTYTSGLSNGGRVLVLYSYLPSCPSAGSLTGTQAICTSSTSQLATNGSNGGAWTSGNTGIATVDNTGLVTGVSAGSAVITYTITGTGGCSNSSASRTITVTAPTTAATLSGNQNVAVGLNSTFTASASGGTWSSSNTGVATVNSSGVVSGISEGTATITYTIPGTGGCSNVISTRVVTVSNCVVTSAGVLSGTQTICAPGTTTFTSTASPVQLDRGLSFIGSTTEQTSDYVTVNSSFPVSSGDFTIEVWVKPTIIDNSYRGFFGSQAQLTQTTSNRDQSMWVGPNGSLHTDYFTGGVRYDMLTSNNFFSADTWTHVAWVKEGTTFKLYKNGVFVTSRTAPANAPAVNGFYWLGRVDNFFSGSLDEFRIWNVARSENQIQLNMNKEVAAQTNLVAYYNFNQGTAAGTNTGLTTLTDGSGSSLNGTLTGFTLSGATSNWVVGATVGGTWTSSDSSIATVHPLTGVITGINAGTATITYTLEATGSCTDPTATRTVTVSGYSSTYNFNTANQLSYFNNGGGAANITQTTNTGIGGTGAVNVVNGGTDIFTSKAGYPNGGVGAVYTFSAFFKNAGTNGYGSLGITTSTGAAHYGTAAPAVGIGVSVHGGGFNYTNNQTSTNVLWSQNGLINWTGGSQFIDNTTSPDGWYKVVLKVKALTSSQYEMTLEVYPANADGSIMTAYTTNPATRHVVTVTNTDLASATSIYPYFGFAGDRFSDFDDYIKSMATAGVLSGTQAICAQATSQFTTNGDIGGVWSSSNTSVATVSTTGLVTSVAAGTATISYTIAGTGVCADLVATRTVTVTGAPTAGTIAGVSTLCTGSTSQLTSNPTTNTNGTWTSSNTAVATVSSTGLVTGVSAGTATITYTVAGSGGCASVSTTSTVTINALPILTSAGASNGTVSTNGLQIHLDAANTSSYSGTGTAWNDLSSSNRNTTLSGSGVTYNSSNGGNLIFNNGTATSNATHSINLQNGYTLVQALKLTNYNGGTFQYNQPNDYINYWMGGGDKMRWETYAGNAMFSNASLPLNAWVVVSSTFSGVSTTGTSGTAKIYINGVLDNTGTLISSATMPATNFIIGEYAGYMNGAVGATLFYNRELTASEIAENYNFFASRYSLPTASSSSGLSACSGQVFTYTPTSNVTGATFTWSRAAVTGISNAAATGTGGVSETLVNTTSSAVTVTYVYTTTANGCSSTNNISVVVYPTPAALTGPGELCIGTNGTLASTTTGGTWSSSNTAVATVSSSGVVTPLTAGTTTITYSLNVGGSCTNLSTTKLVTVTAPPASAGTLSGTQTAFIGGTTTFASTITGGAWTSSNTSVATVNASTGVITGVAAGTATITYTITGTGACAAETVAATRTVTVYACPTIPALSASAYPVCAESNFTLTAAGLSGMSSLSSGIIFKYSTTALSNPYVGGTVIATIPFASLEAASTVARTTTSMATGGTYYIYAILSSTPGGTGCLPYATTTLVVNPKGQVTVPSDIVVCHGTSVAAQTLSTTNSGGTTTYAWTNSATSIGLAASGSTATIPAFTATNTGATAVTATIAVTPTYTAGGLSCPGPVTSYTVTVNPVPVLSAVANQVICAGSTGAVNFNSSAPGTAAQSLTVSSGAIGLAIPDANATGVSSALAVTVPTGATISGISVNFNITHTWDSDLTINLVAPNGQVLNLVRSRGGSANNFTNTTISSASTTSLSTGSAPFTGTFAADAVTGVGPTAYTSTAANFAALYTGITSGNWRLAVRDGGSGDVGTIDAWSITINYNPPPSINWTNSNAAIGLATSGVGNINFTATNPGPDQITSNLTATPFYTNAGLTCTGTPINFTIAVNPKGQVNAVNNQVLCNGSATSAVTFVTTNNGLISSGGTQTASSGTISVSIPDASTTGVTNAIPVTLPTGAVISNVRVTLNMTHTWISDMVINLKAPNGQILNLFEEHGGSGDNLVNTVVSSTGTTSFASGSAPFTGTFAATASIGVGPTGNVSTAANFAALYSTPNGNWTLSLQDLYLGDLGTLTGWSISFDYAVQGAFGTNMNWTNSATSIGLGASGTGHIPSFTATNTGTTPVTSTVTVTPVYFNGGTSCAGTPITYTYTVNPTPTVNTVATQTLCVGTPATVSHAGTVANTVYSWTNSNTAIGLPASGTGSLSFTPTNTGTTPITATITVTPSYTNAGVTCTGTPKTYTIMVNPVGQVSAVTSQILCNGSATTAVAFATVNGGGTVTPGTPITASSGAITVAIPDNNAAGIAHTIPVTLPASSVVTKVTANFNITHTWDSDLSINLVAPNGQVLNLVNRRGGSGANFTNTTISPTATTAIASGSAPFTGTFLPDAAIGAGSTSFASTAANFEALYSVGSGDWKLVLRDHAGGDVGTLTGWSLTFEYGALIPAVTSYAWTNNTPSIGLAASGSGNIASFTATNTTAAPVTSTVTVTPTYTNNGTGCVGTPITYTYTVNPTPTVNVVANQTVCRGSNTAAITFSGATTGTVFTWTNSNTAVGLGASGTGDIASFVGTNTTAAPITATITVTPRYTNAGVTCVGTPRTFTITVNPIPTVNAVTSFPVCHNSPVAVPFSGATTGTVYSWTNTNTAIGLGASGTGNLSFTATNPNTGGAPITATITVTPRYTNNGVTCVGTPTSFTITVNPLPVVSAGTLPSRICISDTLVKLNGTPVGGSWSGIGTSGTNFIPTATNIGSYALTYTYADINGCVNRATITANVLACEERNRDLDNEAVILYPNPNSGQFNLRINSTRFNVLGMKVYNTAGQLVSVKQWGGLVYARVIPVNLTNLAAGIYVVRLYYGDGMDRGADKSYQIIIAR